MLEATQPGALPRISIVTPSFNQGAYVEATVKSILDQRYPNLQYIFMDGGSTDSTLDVLAPYRQHFDYFQSQPDGGQSAALCAGFQRADGDILAYLNSDDVLLPGALNYVAHYFDTHPHVDAVYGHRCVINEENRVIGHWHLPRHSNFLMRRWDLIPQETCFWRASLMKQGGNVDPSYRFAMDYDLFVRFMNSGRFERVDRFLAAFRVHEHSKTSTQLQHIGQQEIKHIQRRYRLAIPPLVGEMFSAVVQLRSARFAAKRKVISGLAAGTGYSIDDMWPRARNAAMSGQTPVHKKAI